MNLEAIGRERLLAGLVREREVCQSALEQLEYTVTQAVEAKALAGQLRVQLARAVEKETAAVSLARRGLHAAAARLVLSTEGGGAQRLRTPIPAGVRTLSTGAQYSRVGSHGDFYRASGDGGAQAATGAALGALAALLGARAQLSLAHAVGRWARGAATVPAPSQSELRSELNRRTPHESAGVRSTPTSPTH
ncbi:hypothetical protein T492DRAFT_846323 [Pavlovales sp. CCMP2436]|nr:hypothetical protein T492DRAFT_846323 [Pavlovales sp. CCMP2436]